MRTWLALLGGLLVWAAHFFAVYGVASIYPGSDRARWLTVVVTLMALGALAIQYRLVAGRFQVEARSELDHWFRGLANLGLALAAIAVLYQGLPALLS
ncbi:hypothetical protein H9L12_01140 [Sphingomonas rhizophila]|uniref:Uncharacterized protein n=1 Tax=Sphingomonas rhizophila TaxID=2071607 RepID=A0A7G9SBQ2_9SPHN|nr:hypothetical protein [Sphingomonas rhizophila]QNN65277.1 hypothetical protein H9L12_01140 [Sphingomonas rhizophila]